MLIPIEQKVEMEFVGIMEKYPDDRILVKITKMDEDAAFILVFLMRWVKESLNFMITVG